jgi:manganese transport protein
MPDKTNYRNDREPEAISKVGHPSIPLHKLKKFLISISPGLFIMGYIIGTGSVTTMASSGASYGMSMTWALALSCIFTYVMVVAISRCTIASGETIIHCIGRRFGKGVAVFIMFGLYMTIITSVMGVTAIASDVFREWTAQISGGSLAVHPIISTTIFIGILYYLFWFGKNRFFLRAMSIVVAIMGICFISSMFMVVPDMGDLAAGLIPRMPVEANASLVLAGLVGTTMAGVVVVSRSYLVAEQGWSLRDVKVENRDAIISLTLTFLVSGSIIASAAGTLFPRGIPVSNAIDMVVPLEPIAGRFASSVFVFGILAAALSSLFGGYLLAPWLIFDFMNKPRKMDHPLVRIGVMLVAVIGYTIPIFGGRPVVIMIASQAISPVVMPLLVVLVFVLLNSRKTVGDYKNPLWLNIGIVMTFIFTLFISYAGVVGLFDFIKNVMSAI